MRALDFEPREIAQEKGEFGDEARRGHGDRRERGDPKWRGLPPGVARRGAKEKRKKEQNAGREEKVGRVRGDDQQKQRGEQSEAAPRFFVVEQKGNGEQPREHRVNKEVVHVMRARRRARNDQRRRERGQAGQAGLARQQIRGQHRQRPPENIDDVVEQKTVFDERRERPGERRRKMHRLVEHHRAAIRRQPRQREQIGPLPCFRTPERRSRGRRGGDRYRWGAN
ncbi:MAG: hypothetical protein M5R36_07225 [Deltaproteobacteria bacterium]|nr:hypothetical protein [Deltaproteobacteria bacterium]